MKPLVTLNTDKRTATYKGRAVEFPPKEFDLLAAIGKANGAVVSREELLETIWGLGSLDIDSRTVDQHLARARRKTEYSVVTTVTSAGFRSEVIRIENAKDSYGTVEEIVRSYGPKPFTTLKVVVAGDMLPTLTEGQRIKVA